ncbi:hypothetical protein K2173_008676 [Erythroxylum novogranatense]|uniref:DNA-directed primase/polymerase protein n=1 Tax=Erythroxylum novogranatense TaxID=1862640 RepID=A0AAV8SLQ5_9ROSI|nr:hypothetical protein K2173_008676 [Erythroxylum novogranatense]
MSSNAKDDVDRLFECFKCGISPPESALREKEKQNKLNHRNEKIKVLESSNTPSPGSERQQMLNTTDGPSSSEKFLGSTSNKVNRTGYGRKISPVVFYGSPHGVPPKRPISLLRLLREIRIDLANEQRSNSRKEFWATFPRQHEAMNFAKEHEQLRVFSYQDHHNGTRRFLVSTYKEFWRRYKNMDSKYRHHYEVIQEGLPCHLYFDLEFSKKENVGKDGDEMVDLLISVVLEALHEKYSIIGNQDWVVELDSSTEEKFSRHLIIRVPKTAFKDNSHAGAFVSEICSRVLTGRDGRFEKLFTAKDSSSLESSVQLFIDNAVYSRNRCFRLALSSKAGKTSVLLPTRRFKCKSMCEEDMFMASLICNMDTDCEKLLVCRMDLDCVRTLQFDTEVNNNFRCRAQDLSLNSCTSDASIAYKIGKSPFPALDNFIESIASVGSVSGKVRSWYWFSEYGLMVYSMSKNRYCERIGREHKSNNVMYVVDLRSAVFYQKCYDPDCRGYRSPLRPIPTSTIPDVSFFYNSEQLRVMHEMELANDNLDYEFVKNDSHAHDIHSSGKDIWWLEASKVADAIETQQKTLTFDDMRERHP